MPRNPADDAAADAIFAAAFGGGPRTMSESELVTQILAECRQLRLCVYRTPRSDRGGVKAGGRGFPDLVIAGPGGLAFRECKSRDGETSAEQDEWAWQLRQAGADWAVWRPADWGSGRIRAELRQLAGR